MTMIKDPKRYAVTEPMSAIKLASYKSLLDFNSETAASIRARGK